METNCEAYEYNATDEGTCHLLNKTSFAAKTVFSDGKHMFTSKVRGLCQRYRTCDNRIYNVKRNIMIQKRKTVNIMIAIKIDYRWQHYK